MRQGYGGFILLLVVSLLSILSLIALRLEKKLLTNSQKLHAFKRNWQQYYQQRQWLVLGEQHLLEGKGIPASGLKITYRELPIVLCNGKYYQIKVPIRKNLCFIEHFAVYVPQHETKEGCLLVEDNFWGRKSLTVGGCL